MVSIVAIHLSVDCNRCVLVITLTTPDTENGTDLTSKWSPTYFVWHPRHHHELVSHGVHIVHLESVDAVVQVGVE